MPPPIPVTKRSIHPGILAVICGAVVLLLLIVLFYCWRASLNSATEARLKAIRAAGQPATARELNAWYAAVPDSENAAAFWMAGFAKLDPPFDADQQPPWARISIPKDAQPLTKKELENIKGWLDDNADALAEFDRAARLPRSRYPVDLSSGTFAESPHLGRLRVSAHLLTLKSMERAHANQSSEAVHSLLDVLAAARSLEQEPRLLSQLTRFARCGTARLVFQYVLHHCVLSDSELASLGIAFEQAENPESAIRGLVGERAVFVTSINSPHEIPIPLNDPDTAEMIREMQLGANSPFARATGFFQRDLRFYLDAMATNISLARLPFPQKFLVASNSAAMAEHAKRRLAMFSALSLPQLQTYIVKQAEHTAGMRCARAAAAVERYRLAHNGKLPSSLAVLVPEFLPAAPVDPFNGEALRYKTEPSGYVIYSVGRDQKDDGAVEAASPERKPQPPDIIFRIRRL